MTNQVQKKPLANFENGLSEMMKKGINSVPSEINIDRLKLNALMAISQDENLSKAAQANPVVTAQMVYNFMIQGLDMLAREAYLVTYKGKLTPVIDYKGLKKIAQKYSVKPIRIILSGVVRENDKYGFNEDGVFWHKFDPFATDKERGKFIGSYCTIKYTDGEVQSTFANADEINKVKNSSPSSKSAYSPWNSWEESMWEKTVIRKGMKYVNLDFGGNEDLAKAYRESDQDVEFTRTQSRATEEQTDAFDVSFTETEVEVPLD